MSKGVAEQFKGRTAAADASNELFGRIGTLCGSVQDLPKNAAEAAAAGGWPVWWRCSLCPFKVHDESTPTCSSISKASRERRKHLRDEHGAVNVPQLPRLGVAQAAKAAEARRVTVEARCSGRVDTISSKNRPGT